MGGISSFDSGLEVGTDGPSSRPLLAGATPGLFGRMTDPSYCAVALRTAARNSGSGLAAHLLGAREDAAVGIEQDQRAGVVELAVGERAVADAEHAGDRAHVACGRAGQRPARRVELALVDDRLQRRGRVARRDPC